MTFSKVVYNFWLWGIIGSVITFVGLGLWTFLPVLGRNRRAEIQRILGADEVTFYGASCVSRFALFGAASWLGLAAIVYIFVSGKAKNAESWREPKIRIRSIEWKIFLLVWITVLVVRWNRGLPVVFWRP